MGDFIEETGVEVLGDGRYRAVLDSWMTWGPMGGYVAAVALRAAATKFSRPAGFVCQYLSVARFEPVELQVETLLGGSAPRPCTCG